MRADLTKENTIFYMVDMQNDFVDPTGALYVKGAEKLVPAIKKLQSDARDKGIREYASVDRHFYSDPEITGSPDWSTTFPPHCMDGTLGQKIVLGLDLDGASYIGNKLDENGSLYVQDTHGLISIINQKNPVVFEKQSNDVSTNKHFFAAMQYLRSQGIRNAIVYGVATDYCVKDAVAGLLSNGLDVYVVADAIAGIDLQNSKKTLDDFVSRNVKLVSSGVMIRMSDEMDR